MNGAALLLDTPSNGEGTEQERAEAFAPVVAERLAAGPGHDAYGAVSVKVAYWATAKVVGRVPATVFHPVPNVESALVRIDRRPAPAVGPEVDPEWLFRLVRAGFGQRRKMLRRSLAALVPAEAFVAAGAVVFGTLARGPLGPRPGRHGPPHAGPATDSCKTIWAASRTSSPNAAAAAP